MYTCTMVVAERNVLTDIVHDDFAVAAIVESDFHVMLNQIEPTTKNRLSFLLFISSQP